MASDPQPRSRNRRTSAILFGYVAREFSLPLACCLGGFTLLFVVIDLFDVLTDLVTSNAAIFDVFRYFAYRQPSNLVDILPISILLSAGYLVSNFGRHHELTAIRAAGVSVTRAFLPVWLIAAAFTVLSLWVGEELAPACRARAETLLDEMTESPAERARKMERGQILAFRSSRTARDWFFERFNSEGEQQGVLVKQFHNRKVAWEARAATARFEKGRWILKDVVRVRYEEDTQLPAGQDEILPELELSDSSDSPLQILSSLRPADRLNIQEMRQVMRANPDLPRSTCNVFRTTIWHRFTFPIACLGAAMIGIALSISPHGASRLRGFSSALGILVAFYVVSQLFVLCGKQGLLPPPVGGGLPVVAFAIWGAWILIRKR